MDNIKGIKQLNSYEKSDYYFFLRGFGNEIPELEDLYKKVRTSKITILYGPSGSGKTSLIRCGLANKYGKNDWLDIMIRKGSMRLLQSAYNELRTNALDVVPRLNESVRNEELAGETYTLLSNVCRDYAGTPIYLIFDQFEEVLIADKEDTSKDRSIQKEVSEKEEFNIFLEKVLKQDLNVRIIISLREEYLGYLDYFEKTIPSLFLNKVRLDRLEMEQLKAITTRILEINGLVIHDAALTELVEKTRDAVSLKFDLPYYQIFMYQFLKYLPQNTSGVISIDTIKEFLLKDAMKLYLDERIERVAESNSINKISVSEIWSVLNELVTNDGTKKQLQLTEIQQVLNRR